MIYHRAVTIAAGTTVSDPYREDMIVTAGLLYRIRVMFPPGPSGLAGIRVNHSGLQILPVEGGGWISGDDTIYDFEDTYLIESPPFQLSIYGYNSDTDYVHTVYVTVGMAHGKREISRYLPGIAYEDLIKRIDALIETQKPLSRDERIKRIDAMLKGKG